MPEATLQNPPDRRAPLSWRVAALLAAATAACAPASVPPPASADTAAQASAAPSAPSFPLPENRAPQSWLVLGPFPQSAETREASIDRDYLSAIGGEANPHIDALTELDVDGKHQSVKPAASTGELGVDLQALYKEDSELQVAYAYGEIEWPREQVLKAAFGSDDGAAVWVNGVRVHRLVTLGRGVDPEADHFDVPLHAGHNRVLVKVENGHGGWGFALKLLDEEGLERARLLALRRHLERIEIEPKSGNHLLGDSFPELVWAHPGEAAQLFAAAAPKVRWFDPELAEVTQPAALGRYQALVEAQTSDGYTYRTLLSFAKVPPGLLPDLPTPPFAEPPPLRSDFFPQLSEPQRAELSRHFWRAFSDYMKSGQGAAIARSELAELAGRPPARAEPAWLQSGFIANAQQQLALRMKLEGRTAHPLAPPATSSRAPELRSGSEHDAKIQPGTVERLRALSKDWVKHDPNGFVVLIARNGVVFMHEGFGGFKKEEGFWPASIGKLVAGLAFGRAVDQGLVRFDDPLSQVFPEWKDERTAKLSFRHCFNHITGFTGHASHGGLFNAYLDQALLMQDGVFVEPLRIHHYNGDGYDLTGQALELITGQNIWRLLYENLQKPFGEPVTQFDLGFGARFTARYLGKLGQMLLQDGQYGTYRFYSPGFLAQLRPERVAVHAPGFPDEKLEWGIGQVWMPDPSSEGREQGVLGPNVIGHGAASGSVFRVDPDHRLVIVIGRDRFRDSAENERFTARFMQTLAAGLVESSKSAPPAPPRVPVASRSSARTPGGPS
jgi:CubicO group peptidase (beta-lactamase class C family)